MLERASKKVQTFLRPPKQARSFVQEAAMITFREYHSATQMLYFKKQFLRTSPASDQSFSHGERCNVSYGEPDVAMSSLLSLAHY